MAGQSDWRRRSQRECRGRTVRQTCHCGKNGEERIGTGTEQGAYMLQRWLEIKGMDSKRRNA